MGLWDDPINTLNPRPPLSGPEPAAEIDLPWVDQLAQNILLTVQAIQRLHASLDGKFTR